MRKRLLLLLCLLVTAGSASAIKIIKSGTFPNGGSWQLSEFDDGERLLYIDAEVIPDYKTKELSIGNWWCSDVTTAPWRKYSCDEKFTLKLSPRVKTIGEYAFAGTKVTNVEFQTRTEPVTIKKGAFFLSDLITFDFSYVKYIGEDAFYYCDKLYNRKFPMLEKCEAGAFDKCRELAKGEIVLGKNVSLSNITGFKYLAELNQQGLLEWYDIGDYKKTYSKWTSPQGSKLTFVWPLEGYSTKSDYFEGIPIMNVIGAEGWSLNVTTGVFHLKGSFLGIDFATPEERPWHELRTQIKEVKLSTAPRMNYFNGCTNLEKVYTSPDFNGVQWVRGNFYGYRIGARAFYGCSKLKSLKTDSKYPTIPNIIDNEAFYNCKELTEIDLFICDRVSDRAFYGCSKLNNLYFSSDLEAIGSEAFAYNTSLSSIKMTGKAPYTSDNVFRGVTASNVTLHIPASVANTYEKAPWNAFKLDKSFAFDENGIIRGATQYQKWELTSNGILKVTGSMNIPDYDDITTQPWYNYRELIKDIIIDGYIEGIGKNAFAIPDGEESQVLTVAIPRFLKNIGEGAFRNQNSLKNIYISNVETLGSYAFAGCSSLETIELGMKLASVGDYVFKDCHKLNEIENMTSTPATTTQYSFAGIKSSVYNLRGGPRKANDGQETVNLNVPDAYVTTYMLDENWSQFHIAYADDRGQWVKAGKFGDGMWILYDDGTMVVCADEGMPKSGYNSHFYNARMAQLELKFAADPDNPTATDPMLMTKHLEIGGDIAELGAYFANFKNLEGVKITAPIRELYRTFSGCTKLNEINLDSVENIGIETFMGTALTEVKLPAATFVGSKAFKDCAQLKTAAFGASCEIQSSVFENCTSLTDVHLATVNVNSASTDVFKNCTSLKKVDFQGTTVVPSMFEGCSALEEINLGGSLKSVGNYAFGGCTALKTIHVSTPTPAQLWKVMEDVTVGGSTQRVQVSPFISSDLTGEVNYKQINLQLPNTFIVAYTSAMKYLWREMKISVDEEYEDDMLPVFGSIQGFKAGGWWELDTDGLLTIDGLGDMPAYRPDKNYWYYTFAPWLYFIKTVDVNDDVTSVADYLFAIHDEDIASSSAGVTTVILGEKLRKVGYMAFPFSGIKDVYLYAEDLVDFHGGTFNMDAVVANNATLHVLKDAEDKYLNYYKNHLPTKNFPNIVADLDPRHPKVQAVTFDIAEVTLRPGQELQLEPRFTPADVENKKLRYEDVSKGHHVYIDDDNNIIFAQSEGVAYIQAYSSYTISGEEVMALWGPTHEIYLKVTVTEPEPGEEIFFDYREGEATDAPTISCHVLKNEQIDVDHWLQTCEIAGPYNEDEILTQAIPEWRTGAVNIPEEAMGYEVVRVGAYAFYERQISALYIPWTVTQIGYNACAYCDYLTDVYIPSFKPLRLTDAYGEEDENLWNNDAFYRIGEGDDGEGYATLHVPAGSKAAWNIYPWNEWFRFIVEDAEIPDGINETYGAYGANEAYGTYGDWFDLSGRKLGSKPTMPGLYIMNGRKVVVK